MGSNTCRENSTTRCCSPHRGKIFSGTGGNRGMESIQDLSGVEKPKFGFVLYFVNFEWKTQFFYVKRTEL